MKKETQESNAIAVSRLLSRQNSAPSLDAIYEAKHIINTINKSHPMSKSVITVEIEPVGLHLLEDLMTSLGGHVHNYTGILLFEGGKIIVRTI